MLAHSPPFPLVIGYSPPDHELTTENEEELMLALRHRERVRFIYLYVTVPSLKRVLPTLDGEFPALEYLHIAPPYDHDAHFTLSLTFEAPHLRYIDLTHFASQMDTLLLSTATGLVMLLLYWVHPSTYPNPNNFLQLLSLLPQLERIYLSFRSPSPNRDIESQMLQAPITIHVIHPNLRLFDFKGVSGFLETILPHMTAPLLGTFRVQFFNQLRFSIPHLANFMMNIEEVRSCHVNFGFHHEAVVLSSHTAVGTRLGSLEVIVSCRHLDWQVSSVTQISNILHPLFSEVTDLTLDYRKHTLSSEWHNQADHTHWREILESFRNVKTLRVHHGLVGEVSRALKLDGEPPLGILPELEVLICPTRSVNDKTFELFIQERELTGQPVSLIGETLPVGPTRYTFYTSTGDIEIEPDQDPPL